MSDEQPITLCGSLSLYPVGLGAAMHNAGYRALGLPWHYVPFGVKDLPASMKAMRALGIRGFGISMPFKLDVMPLLDAIEQRAERIGAVNTVVNTDGILRGHNTDWEGAARAIEEVRSLESARVLLLGAGGAARAVAHGMLERGAILTLCNRDDSRAQQLASDVRGAFIPYEARNDLAPFDIIINASSRGMNDVDPRSPVPVDALKAQHVVLDAVYKPVETVLVAEARKRGATAIDGSRMLLHQAAAQFELYSGRTAPLAAMDEALRAQLR